MIHLLRMTDDSLLKVHRKVGPSSMIKCSPESFIEDKFSQINLELLLFVEARFEVYRSKIQPLPKSSSFQFNLFSNPVMRAKMAICRRYQHPLR